jgi:hypothetical protein
LPPGPILSIESHKTGVVSPYFDQMATLVAMMVAIFSTDFYRRPT